MALTDLLWYPTELVAALKKVLKLARVLSALGLARQSRHGSSNTPVAKIMLKLIRTAVGLSMGDSPAVANAIPSSI